jgi:GntR family transcriptional repressor for pyruvate dehydrogenase complex
MSLPRSKLEPHLNAPSSEDDDVKVQKLSHAVAERLRGQIVSGQRKSGDRLPPETDLLAQFKVSRPTVREALRILEVESLISLGRGGRSGALVLGPTVKRAAEYAAMVLVSSGTTFGELHDARAILEPSLVMQHAQKRDPKLFDELEGLLDAATTSIAAADFPAAVNGLNHFHTALVQASDNRALMLMIDMLKVLSEQAVDFLAEDSGAAKNAVRGNLTKTVTAYRQLVELMRQGKAEESQAFWRKYMERARAFLERTGLGARKIQHR